MPETSQEIYAWVQLELQNLNLELLQKGLAIWMLSWRYQKFLEQFLFKISTAQKIKFSIIDFSSKCDQVRNFLRIWSRLLKKSLMENFIFCVVENQRDSKQKTFFDIQEKAPSNKTPMLSKSMNMVIWVVGTSDQLFIRGS